MTIAAAPLLVPFSPPDIGTAEIDEVVRTLESGWLTTFCATANVIVNAGAGSSNTPFFSARSAGTRNGSLTDEAPRGSPIA